MKLRSGSQNWLATWIILCLLAIIAACGTISPRRIVTNNPPGSPTPTATSTPSPGTTPTITPTPTPMASVVPAQFLFTADPAARLIIGFKINSDGGLSPIPGSPFRTMDTPRQLLANGSTLLIAGDNGITAFVVSKDTGAISRSSSMSMEAVSQLAAKGGPASATVLDASGRFLYILDPARAEIAAFSVRDGQTVPLSPAAYRAAPGASLAVVRP
jgi:hypothetical protein